MIALLAALAALILLGAAYAALRWLESRLGRLCGCYFCSARREMEARSLSRGPSRFQSRAGHLRYLVRLLFTR